MIRPLRPEAVADGAEPASELLLERHATTLVLRINRPEARNALTQTVPMGLGQRPAGGESLQGTAPPGPDRPVRLVRPAVWQGP